MVRITQSVLVMFSLVGPSALVADDCQPLAMVVRTTDGSSLTGLMETRSVALEAAYGRVDVPMRGVEVIKFDSNREVARVSLGGGDQLSGAIDAEHLRLVTAIGTLCIPWTKVAEVRVRKETRPLLDPTYRPHTPRPVRFNATLRDGSEVVGVPDHNSATLYCALGQLELPWALGREVSFHDDRETCTIQLWNGDALAGCVDWKAFALATGLGPVHLSTVHTKRIDLSLGGVDLVEKPYAKASGNRFFRSALKATQPRRMLGRTYPAAQFIEAHASGRIEYTFEHPVREFHATLAMYETYCATKGNVIFKVETEQGTVYSSRPIRNFQQEEVYVRFQPSKKLVLITDQNGSPDEDWSVWLRPEAR